MVLRFADSPAFWSAATDRWSRSAYGFEVPPGDEPFDVDDVFLALTAEGERDRMDWISVAAVPEPRDVRDFRMVTFRRFGPTAADGDLAGWLSRLSSDGLVFGCNVHDLGRRNPHLQPVATLFAERLAAVPDASSIRTWELDAFLGNYPVTPLGIHQDNAAVFSFCLYGSRTYLLWPPDHFPPGHPDLTRPDPEVVRRNTASATRVEVTPGRGVFWPPGFWHVVLGAGTPFAVAQVSAYFRGTAASA